MEHSFDDDPTNMSNVRCSEIERNALASVAHDICNHLQIASSALNILQREIPLDAATFAEIAITGARHSLERAAKLSRALVDGGNAAKNVFKRVSIAERLVALREVVVLASGPAVFVKHFVCDDVPDVYCAANELDEAILNIVANAGRAMPSGGRVSIAATREVVAAFPLPCAVLRIADTGCGMPPEIAARVFEPRFTTRAPGEGSGIGLSTVAHFARTAGGSVQLDSRQGVGTVVTLRLPGLLKDAKAACRDC
jgi:signal transduction histidine kinase